MKTSTLTHPAMLALLADAGPALLDHLVAARRVLVQRDAAPDPTASVWLVRADSRLFRVFLASANQRFSDFEELS